MCICLKYHFTNSNHTFFFWFWTITRHDLRTDFTLKWQTKRKHTEKPHRWCLFSSYTLSAHRHVECWLLIIIKMFSLWHCSFSTHISLFLLKTYITFFRNCVLQMSLPSSYCYILWVSFQALLLTDNEAGFEEKTKPIVMENQNVHLKKWSHCCWWEFSVEKKIHYLLENFNFAQNKKGIARFSSEYLRASNFIS